MSDGEPIAKIELKKVAVAQGVRCRKCGTDMVSAHRHDFRWCPCNTVAVDGGRDYLRVVGNPDDYEEITVEIEVE